MPKAIGEFINELALKAGVPSDDKDLVSVLASPELTNIKIPDELVTSMDKGLINITEAQNNHPVIKNKYFADAYDGMDKHLVNLLDEETLSPEDIAEIKGLKSTAKKIELTVKKLKDAKAAASPSDKAAINKQLTELNEALRIEKESKKELEKTYEGKIKSIHLQTALNSKFANFKTIHDDQPGNIKSAILKAIIDQALQDNNAEFTVDEQGTLQIIRKDGTNVFGSDNRPLTPDSFLNKTFAPILKVSGPKPVQTPTPQAVPTNGTATNGFLSSHNQQVLADMQAQSANTML